LKNDNPNLKIGNDTLYGMFHAQAMRYGEKPCLYAKKEGRYTAYSWIVCDERILNLAGFLLTCGLQKGDRVALLLHNCPEWALIDLALLAIGCINVPIYPTLTSQEVEALITHAEARCLWTKESSLSKRFTQWKGDLFVLTDRFWEEALQTGKTYRREHPEALKARLEDVQTGDLASIIYTSGTTGDSKGVMLTHQNFLSNCKACQQAIPLSSKDRYLSFLPLSHVFERMAGFYFFLSQGGEIAYAESLETVLQNIHEIHPTVVSGVPRFFEKIYEKIQFNIQQKSSFQQTLFHWAIRVGTERAEAEAENRPLPFAIAWQWLWASLILSHLKKRIGPSIRFFISGSAPLSIKIIEFFGAIGFMILEGYGLTESSPVISVNREHRRKWGSVGPPIEGVEVSIAEDGEIWVKGPNVMQGYYKNPEATQAVFQEGYLLTGDIGYLDEAGFLFITDRKKDLIKTSGGKFVSPQKIEGLLKRDPLIDEALVYGEKEKYIVALLIPNFDLLERHAKTKGLQYPNREALLGHPDIHAIYEKRVARCLKDVASFEKIKKFALLDKAFSQTEGELTPTLKVKRQQVYEKHHAMIESLFQHQNEY